VQPWVIRVLFLALVEWSDADTDNAGSATLAYNCASAARFLGLPALQSTTTATVGATLAGVTATISIGVTTANNASGDNRDGNPPTDDTTVLE
jgi:hypothetical protein